MTIRGRNAVKSGLVQSPCELAVGVGRDTVWQGIVGQTTARPLSDTMGSRDVCQISAHHRVTAERHASSAFGLSPED